MYSNMNNKYFLDFDKIITELKKLLDNFLEKFSDLNFKNQDSMDNLVKIYSSDVKFLEKLDNINNLMNDISDKLEVLDIFKNEFHNFLSIQNMINYIIGDIKRYIIHFSFVRDLSLSFCELINAKIGLIKNNENEIYDEIYEKFDCYLFKQEEFFNLNIYEPTHQYDDLIDEVTNILW